MDLFEFTSQKASDDAKPLAAKMRPRALDEFIGQEDVAGKGTLIYNAIKNDRIFSMIFWGPPGCGKTTLAKIIARETRSHFIQISAVLSGVRDIRSVIEEAKNQRTIYQRKTILFVDEIHRFNKAQQDAFLHHVESGLITLIGATTENPSFEVIPALNSRCRVITLHPLSDKHIAQLLKHTLNDRDRGLGMMNLVFTDDALAHLVFIADGDARTAINSLELTASLLTPDTDKSGEEQNKTITLTDVEQALQKKALRYDKTGEEHYNLISAFHKSLRGSDPDAALYWLGRMLAAGEDPVYIARRMVRFASEDVGNADPYALQITMSAMEAYRFLGYPEGDLALAQAAVYLATAPRSNSIYSAYNDVRDTIKKTGTLPPPMHIRNASTRLMKDLGYGRGYRYAHDYKEGYVPQEYLPEKLRDRLFYVPTDRGYEKTIKQRLDRWRSLKKRSERNE